MAYTGVSLYVARTCFYCFHPPSSTQFFLIAADVRADSLLA